MLTQVELAIRLCENSLLIELGGQGVSERVGVPLRICCYWDLGTSNILVTLPTYERIEDYHTIIYREESSRLPRHNTILCPYCGRVAYLEIGDMPIGEHTCIICEARFPIGKVHNPSFTVDRETFFQKLRELCISYGGTLLRRMEGDSAMTAHFEGVALFVIEEIERETDECQ